MNESVSSKEKRSQLAELMSYFVLQTDEMDSAQLKEKIEVAIAELDVPKSPISSVTYQQGGFDEAIFLP